MADGVEDIEFRFEFNAVYAKAHTVTGHTFALSLEIDLALCFWGISQSPTTGRMIS